MILITEQAEERFAAIGDQKGIDNPIVIVKLQARSKTAYWYLTSYDQDNKIAYGAVVDRTGNCTWNHFSIIELENIDKLYPRKTFISEVECDFTFQPVRFSKLGL